MADGQSYICLIIALLISLLASSSLCAQDIIDLSGNHPVTGDDNLDYAQPNYDDSGWQKSVLPSSQSWEDMGGKADRYVRWQRIRFEVSDELKLSRPALLLGIVSGADKVYLNGQLIGETANLDADYTVWETTNYSQVWTRIYRFDEKLLNNGKANVLAIRFARFKDGNSGVLQGPLAIADIGTAYELSHQMVTRHNIIASLLMVFDIMVAVAIILFFMIGFRDQIYIYAALTYACVFFGMIFLSTLLRKNGIEVWAFLEVYLLKFAPCLFVPLTSFVSRVLRFPVPNWARVLQAALLITTLIFPLTGLGLLSIALDAATVLEQLISVALLGLLVYWAFLALRSGNKAGWPLLVGLGSFFIALFYEFFVDWHALVVWLGHPPSYFTFRLFLVCLAIMVAQNYLSIQRRLDNAREDILRAHEIERSRLARDIHDGIGQWLSSIKLDLQLFKRSERSDESQPQLESVMGHIDEAISDTRRIAHDLSPVMIEKYGFSTAVSNHVDAIAEKFALKSTIRIDETIVLTKNTESHLYRIFQEALKNAVTHGKATQISVTLSQTKKSIVFEVSDNGCGFDMNNHSLGSKGLGLASMQERASLLSANCQIRSKLDRGTSIRLIF